MIIHVELDKEGCIEPDNDEPQSMGDKSVVVCILVVNNS
jgi:hypothetical protein